jgi:hypothetical protein
VVTITHVALDLVGTLGTEVDQQVALHKVCVVATCDIRSTGEAPAAGLERRVDLKVGTVGPAVVVKVDIGSVGRNLATRQSPLGGVGVLAPLNLGQLALDVTAAVSRVAGQLNIETDGKDATCLDATDVSADFDLVAANVPPRVRRVSGARAARGTVLAAVLGNTDRVRAKATSSAVIPPVTRLVTVVAAGARVAAAARSRLAATISGVARVNVVPAAGIRVHFLDGGPAQTSLTVRGIGESGTGNDRVTTAPHFIVLSVGLDLRQKTHKGVQVGTQVGKISSTRGPAGDLVSIRVGTPGGNPHAAGLVVEVLSSGRPLELTILIKVRLLSSLEVIGLRGEVEIWLQNTKLGRNRLDRRGSGHRSWGRGRWMQPVTPLSCATGVTPPVLNTFIVITISVQPITIITVIIVTPSISWSDKCQQENGRKQGEPQSGRRHFIRYKYKSVHSKFREWTGRVGGRERGGGKVVRYRESYTEYRFCFVGCFRFCWSFFMVPEIR